MTGPDRSLDPASMLGRRSWRRMERRARRAHERDLQRHLADVARSRPTVLGGNVSSTHGVVSLRLSGHRLILGGVAPAPARELQTLARSPAPLELVGAGRYGPFWWISVAGTGERVILSTHLHLDHDRGPAHERRADLPVLSGVH